MKAKRILKHGLIRAGQKLWRFGEGGPWVRRVEFGGIIGRDLAKKLTRKPDWHGYNGWAWLDKHPRRGADSVPKKRILMEEPDFQVSHTLWNNKYNKAMTLRFFTEEAPDGSGRVKRRLAVTVKKPKELPRSEAVKIVHSFLKSVDAKRDWMPQNFSYE